MIDEFRKLSKRFQSFNCPMPRVQVSEKAMWEIALELDEVRLIDRNHKRLGLPYEINLFGIIITVDQ